MPSIVPCETRSPPSSPVQSPPRKKFKFSLKLKSKKKSNLKSASTGDNEHESKEQKCRKAECVQNKEDKETTTNGPSVQDDTSTSLADETEMVTPPLPFAGLANLGNTCYVNAVLQVLRYCPEFLKSLANLDEISAQNGTLKGQGTILADDDSTLDNEDVTFSRPNIIRSVHKLTSEMENAEEEYNKMGMEAEQVKNRSGCTTLAVRPRDFVKEFSGLRPMFGEYQQHDAQEFLRAFLSLVEEDCVGLLKGDQKDSVKENTMPPNSSESKVRGGCKYPNSNVDDIVETVAEPTSMMSTADSPRSEADCPEEQSNPTLSCASKTVTPTKSFPNDLNCPKCAASSDDMNLVKRLFEGTLLLQTCCLNCEGVRRRYEKFQDISVPVQNSKHGNSSDNLEEVNAFSDSEDESEKDVNLSWAISKFASVERLNGENKYFCDSCATLTEAEISTYFERLPRVLTIHLKRFQTSYGQSLYSSSWVTKVTKSLHTPQQLSLKPWCSKTCSERSAVYNLFGVVMHSGMSSCSGHYLSYVNVDILNDQGVVSGLSPRKPSKCGCGTDENGDENTVCQKTDEEAMEIESDCIKEDVKAVDQDESCSSPWGADITRYFKPLRKSRVSVQKSTVGNLSCKEDTATYGKSTCSADSSGDKTSLTPAKICGQEPTDLSMNRHSTAETATNGEHSDPKCLDTSNTDSPVSTSHAEWLKFDDAEVQEISGKDMNEILSPSSSCYSTPYLLFYFRS